MQEFITLLFLGIGLSMDTFSLSLSIGTLKISNKQIREISIIIGIMHFIMPLIGLVLGSGLITFLNMNTKYFLSIILFVLSIKLILDLFSNEELKINLNIIGIFLFSLLVSLDSFSTGIGLSSITGNILLATTIFSICSFSFTYMGLIIGKYTSSKLGKYANVIGIIILLGVAIAHLCK